MDEVFIFVVFIKLMLVKGITQIAIQCRLFSVAAHCFPRCHEELQFILRTSAVSKARSRFLQGIQTRGTATIIRPIENHLLSHRSQRSFAPNSQRKLWQLPSKLIYILHISVGKTRKLLWESEDDKTPATSVLLVSRHIASPRKAECFFEAMLHILFLVI